LNGSTVWVKVFVRVQFRFARGGALVPGTAKGIPRTVSFGKKSDGIVRSPVIQGIRRGVGLS